MQVLMYKTLKKGLTLNIEDQNQVCNGDSARFETEDKR